MYFLHRLEARMWVHMRQRTVQLAKDNRKNTAKKKKNLSSFFLTKLLEVLVLPNTQNSECCKN